jgi:hypothetical protein
MRGGRLTGGTDRSGRLTVTIQVGKEKDKDPFRTARIGSVIDLLGSVVVLVPADEATLSDLDQASITIRNDEDVWVMTDSCRISPVQLPAATRASSVDGKQPTTHFSGLICHVPNDRMSGQEYAPATGHRATGRRADAQPLNPDTGLPAT